MKISDIVSESAIQAGGAPPGPAPAGASTSGDSADVPFNILGNPEKLPGYEIKRRKNIKDSNKSVFTANTIRVIDYDEEDKNISKKRKGKIKHIYSPNPMGQAS